MGLESCSRAELNVKGVRQGDEPALTIALGVLWALSHIVRLFVSRRS